MNAIHEQDRQRVADMLAQPVVAGPEPAAPSDTRRGAFQWLFISASDIEVRLRASDGAYRWFLIRARIVSDADGRPAKRFGTATDIDDLKQTERALRQSEQEVRRASAQLIKTQDEERRRIAREIHDTTLQDLVAATLQIDQVRNGTIAAGDADRTLEEVRGLITRSQKDLRTLSYLMHPPMLDAVGLAAAVQWYARGFAQRSGIRVTVEAPEDLPRLFDDVEMALFRVVQEGLANVYRHSGSEDAEIVIDRHAQTVTLQITDHGKGLDSRPRARNLPGEVAMGVGIPGMRLRLQQIGGTLELRSGGHGTTLIATVPLVTPPGLTAC
jgi:signal transduction histidine kinase